MEALQIAAQALGKAMYEAASQQTAGGAAGGEGAASGGDSENANDDDVIDAEYEVKK